MLPSSLGSVGLDGSGAFGGSSSTGVGLAPIGTAFDADFPALANRAGNSQSSRPGSYVK